jgi:hypothetical protein
MLLAGVRTIERPRLVEPPDDSKGYLFARLDEVSVARPSAHSLSPAVEAEAA